MGIFLAATALRDVTVREVVPEVQSWFEARFIVCSEAPGVEPSSGTNAVVVFEPHNSWTTTIWPSYFGFHSEMAGYLSARLRTVASSVDVYDSDMWQHVAYRDGELVDEYATDPSYLVSTPADRRAVARRWRGDPEAVARHVGGSAREITRLYRRNRRSRNFDDWSFTELWAEIGIEYPVEVVPVAKTLLLPDNWPQALQLSQRQ